ncbi:MAG: AEC family transporter [Calditrichaeota bacterium]|nr:MAG: AEC family transporter [Calditrichota bacterium]
MHIVDSLLPVFAIIALGAALARTGFFTGEILNSLTRLAYWVGLPCFLFQKIATATYAGGPILQIFKVMVLATAGSAVVGFLIAVFSRLPRRSVGTFVQATFRGNLAFIGLPVVVYSTSGLWGNHASPETMAVLAIAPMVPIYNASSVLILLSSQHPLKLRDLKALGVQILSNPLLISSVAGVGASLLGLALPGPLSRTLDLVGQMSLPLALLSIGGTLALIQTRGRLLHSFAAALVKVGVTPLLGFFLASLFGLGLTATRVALIYLACPTAASSFILADQLKGDSALAASAVLTSTLLSVGSLTVAMLLR